MTNLGFNVEIFDNDSYGRNEDAGSIFKAKIETLSNSSQLHGMYMMGHGGSNFIGSEGWHPFQLSTVLGPLWSIPYTGNNSIQSRLDYQLGALVIHACESENSNARSLTSANGIFHGEIGTYYPFFVSPIAEHWGFELGFLNDVVTYGGKQKTKIFIPTAHA
jgi:hypothetical protein